MKKTSSQMTSFLSSDVVRIGEKRTDRFLRERWLFHVILLIEQRWDENRKKEQNTERKREKTTTYPDLEESVELLVPVYRRHAEYDVEVLLQV
jgi:hypothetical protein